MPLFKFVISEPETRKAYQVEVDQNRAVGLMGKKIGEEFDGDIIGLSGYSLKITGGTDKDGFPMHPQVKGMGRKKVLLANAPCYHPKSKGQRKRKMVRGDTISDAIAQINVKVLKKGAKPLEEIAPSKKKEEKKVEVKEEKKAEVKEEKKEEKPKTEEKPKEVKKAEEKPVGGEEGKEKKS